MVPVGLTRSGSAFDRWLRLRVHSAPLRPSWRRRAWTVSGCIADGRDWSARFAGADGIDSTSRGCVIRLGQQQATVCEVKTMLRHRHWQIVKRWFRCIIKTNLDRSVSYLFRAILDSGRSNKTKVHVGLMACLSVDPIYRRSSRWSRDERTLRAADYCRRRRQRWTARCKNALQQLNELRPGLEYRVVSQTGPCFAATEWTEAGSWVPRRVSDWTVSSSRVHRPRATVRTGRLFVAWYSGRTLVFDRWTSPVLRSTCSWWVTTYVGKR